MSARRFCAGEDELCESVPSRAPNSLWPRLRSSSAPLPYRAALRSRSVLRSATPAEDDGGRLLSSGEDRGGRSSWSLSRRRLLSASEMEDFLRFRPFSGDAGTSLSGSGNATADAISLGVGLACRLEGEEIEEFRKKQTFRP